MVGLHRAEVLAGFLGQSHKSLGRAHNFEAKRRSYSGLYLDKSSQSLHDNGVPLEIPLFAPVFTCIYVGIASPSFVPSCAFLWLSVGMLSNGLSP